MGDATDWHPTNRYKPGLGIGVPVERIQLGFAKMGPVENEKLASDLAKLIPAPVPHVEIVRAVRGQGPCAISHVHSPRSRPLATKEGFPQQDYSPAEKTALKRASGLLPFLAWIAADDHYDNTNLVVDELGNDLFHVVAIDFEHAFAWAHGEEAIVLPAPPALVAYVDPLLVSDSLAVIERLTAAQISGCCAVFEHRPDLRKWIEGVLQRRQPLLRAPLAARRWLG
jgi:hypothetical protein